jgi:DNA-binding NtrC family response regulator/tetratricopeptide (TPR) repeat protein
MAATKATSLLGVIEKPAAVHRLRAKASLAVGRHAEALDAVRCARRSRRAAEQPALLALEELDALFGLMRHGEAVGVATRALRRRPADDDLEARLRVARGQALWSLGRIGAGVAEARKALAIATTDLTLARAREALGLFAWKEQDLEDAARHLASARQLYTQASSRDGLARTLEKQGAVLRDADKLADALRVQTLRVEIASTTTRFDAAARALSDRGSLLVVMGRWGEARQDLDRACDLFARVSDPREHTLAGVSRAALDLATGDSGAARAALAGAGRVDAACGRDPRSRAEMLLGLADVDLAEGDAPAAERSLGEALGLLDLVRDRVGQCRARFRRSHVLLALGRTTEAVREARRALRLACWPARTDLRGAAELALGRALLHARRAEACPAFERALALSAARPGVARLARFGRALARGAGRDDPETREALASIEDWGDRRLLASCLEDLDRLRGPAPRAARPRAQRDPGEAHATCAAARVIGDVAVGFAGQGEWRARWGAAARALRPLLPWHRIAYVAADAGWELRADWTEAAVLAAADPARTLAAGIGAPACFDLTGEPALREHPIRLLHGVRWALVAPAGPGAALYADLRENDPAPGGREADVLGQLGRLVERDPPDEPGGAADPAPAFPEIVGACAAMDALFRQMERLAGSQITVQILGETGTGKERVAQALHRRSPRGDKPFVAINASTLSDDLFEAEMFGHARGAFTGAVAERAGHLAEAEGGTLLIDEVADLTPRAQAKLLRVLQEREYRRLGESRTRRADVRILTASNVALDARAARGLFREDLVYRLSPVVLSLPPLRERGPDLLRLARHFLRRAADQEGRGAPGLTGEVAAALSRYAWPGNVRELENEMHRLVALAGFGPLRPEHLSEKLRARGAPSPVALRSAVMAFEKEHVARVLAQHAGNRAHAAAALCITRQALVVKIRRLGLS